MESVAETETNECCEKCCCELEAVGKKKHNWWKKFSNVLLAIPRKIAYNRESKKRLKAHFDSVAKEVELVCKKENPDWDGKSFDYGCTCYTVAFKAYKKAYKELWKGDFSGFSHSMAVAIVKRLLDEKILSPIGEEDFEETPYRVETVDGVITNYYNCHRYHPLYKMEVINGEVKEVSYRDIHRKTIVDQYGLTWSCGASYEKFVPPIKLPYSPPNKSYEIYTNEFTYNQESGEFSKERGVYNAYYVEKVVYPDGEVKKIGKYYLVGEEDKPYDFTPEQIKKIKKVIRDDLKLHKEWQENRFE